MNNKKKKYLVAIVSLVLLLGLGGTYAVFVTSTDQTQNVSTPSLGISLVQTPDPDKNPSSITNDEIGTLGINYNSVLPNTNINETMLVQAEDDSQDTYVRVTLTRYWIEKESNKIALDENEEGYLDPSAITINTTKSKDWIVRYDENDPEVVYFYYTKPLSAGVKTSNFVEGLTILPNSVGNTNEYSGYGTHVDYFAEGVQVLAGKDAMLAEWGVNVTIDSNNVITDVVEQ